MPFLKLTQLFFFFLAFLFTRQALAFVEDFKGANFFIFEAQTESAELEDYQKSIEKLFEGFELAANKKIAKGEKRKVGIKVYTNSGAGLCTPLNLVRAVIRHLEKLGYEKSEICIVDMSRRKLRECGYLPKYAELSMGASDNFEGSPVYDIESGKFFSPDWFYDNPLMPRDMSYYEDGRLTQPEEEARKSYLPVSLFLTVDFWINMPMITDMKGIGVSAALGNSTIWNMSNNERFFQTPANAPIAVAECAAIPELNESQIFTILTLQRYQYVGDNIFNARFCESEKSILLSADPVILDYIALDYINKARVKNSFEPIFPLPAMFDYAEQLNLGSTNLSKFKFRKVR